MYVLQTNAQPLSYRSSFNLFTEQKRMRIELIIATGDKQSHSLIKTQFKTANEKKNPSLEHLSLSTP
jgi:hypothetical protein